MGRAAGIKFKRVADAFDMAAKARVTCSESSGSSEVQSSESFTDLSDLVNSFLHGEDIDGVGYNKCKLDETSDENEGEDYWDNCVDLLQDYLNEICSDDYVNISNIQSEVEAACHVVGVDRSSPEFKRRLMVFLRERGFDAGLCKSQWRKTGQTPPGKYEYIDVNVGGDRYIVEVLIAGEFQVARSTDGYDLLLESLPPIFVGKAELLKRIVRLMCRAVKKCMKKYEMHVPPWRRYAYMEAKWFSSDYKRTINDVSDKKRSGGKSEKKSDERAVGFVAMQQQGTKFSYYCREACVSNVGLRVGNLAMVRASPITPTP